MAGAADEQRGNQDGCGPVDRELLEPMVVRDPAMLALMRHVEQVAPSNATVLITGESGTGKKLIAAHLHCSAGPPDRPFVVLNCAAISDATLEGELFGYENHPHSGTTPRRVSKFAAASGGTLLLDAIDEMDLPMQAKLLRALQQREISQPGGDPARADVRIVVATSRNLQQEVRLGRFRADLFFRLNVVAVKVPPLRERPADIPALAEFFAATFARANNLPARTVSPEAVALLLRHSWPGNVRELENVMFRAVLIETGPCTTPSAIDIDPEAESLSDTQEALDPPGAPVGPSSTGRPLVHTTGRTIEAVERDMILDTLWQCKGNRGQTAAVLGISIRTLRNKLNEYERDGSRIPRPVVVAVA